MTINAMMQATVNAPRRSSDRDSHHVSRLHDLANAPIAASRILAPGGERGSLIKARQWVPQEGADDKRDFISRKGLLRSVRLGTRKLDRREWRQCRLMAQSGPTATSPCLSAFG